MVEDIIVVLDIGSKKISCLVGEYSVYNVFEIISSVTVESFGIKNGKIINMENLKKCIDEVFCEVEKSCGINRFPAIYVSMSNSSINSINGTGVEAFNSNRSETYIKENNINNSIESAKKINLSMDSSFLNVIPQFFKVDESEKIENPVGMIVHKKLEAGMHIISCSSAIKNNFKKILNILNLSIKDFYYSGYAAAEEVLTEHEKEIGTLLIDIGGGTTDIIYYEDGKPYFSSTSELSSYHVTADLAQAFKIPFEDAEKLKIENGCCYLELLDKVDEIIYISTNNSYDQVKIPKSKACYVMACRMGEIIKICKEKIESKGLFDKIKKVVITGGGANMVGIKELVDYYFKKDSRIGYISNCPGVNEEFYKPDFATTFGLLKIAKREIESEFGSDFNMIKDSTKKSKNNNGNIKEKLYNFIKAFL